MKIQTVFILYINFVVVAIIASLLTIEQKLNFELDENVIVLTDKNFKLVLKQYNNILVEFYAPWCGHCKQLAPEYAKAATILKDSKSNVALGKLDATEQKQVASQFKIQGFPTLKFFRNGNPSEYTGGRTSSEILEWIEKKTGPSSHLLTSKQELEEYKQDNDVIFAYFGLSENDKEFQEFQSLGHDYDHIKFVHIFNQEVLDQLNIQKGKPALRLYKNFDEKLNEYQNEVTVDKIKKFLEEFSHPLVMPWGDAASSKIYSNKNTGVLLFHEPNDEESIKLLQEIAKIRKIKESIIFSSINSQNSNYSKLQESIGASSLSYPALFILDSKNEANYLMEVEFNEKNINRFINQFKSKKLTKYIKSLPIPENNPNEAVLNIVRKNYDSVVKNSKQDLFVMYYATWCGHCNQYKPKLEALAQKFKVNPNVIFGKYDAVNNAVEDVQISGYPTIFFFKNGSKSQPIKYEGNRDENDVIQFIKQHTSYPWVDILHEE